MPLRNRISAVLQTAGPALWSRREFLRLVGAGGVALGMGTAAIPSVRGDENDPLPTGKKLIVRSAKPLNAEPALDKLVADWITPLEFFYIRNHGPTPNVDAAGHRLSVEGLVDKPLTLSLAELNQRFPAVSAPATLTCAGNRRSEFSGPEIGGVAWGAGAIGNAEWSGVSLSSILRHAGVRNSAKHVWFEGADEIVDKAERYPFGGSIPLEKALADSDRIPGALLATKMNGKALTAEHGFPLRAVVPGYIGARSVKWLKRIVVSDRPSPNHYLAQAYKLVPEDTPAAYQAAQPLYEYALNSVICNPASEAAVSAGRLKIQGFALPGGAAGRAIKEIELSTDGGKTWAPAKVASKTHDFCWVLWTAEVPVTARTEELLVRTSDSTGETQPREMPWNAKGYQYNAWHRVALKVG